MRPAAILFDFDGVIADSEAASAIVFSEALSAAGLPTTLEEAADRYTGLHRDDTLRVIADQWGVRVPADIAERLSVHADLVFGRGIPPVPGALAFIAALGDLPIAIGSSSTTAYLNGLVGAFGLAERFAGHVYSGREHVARGKPHPDIYLHAAAALGVDPRDTLIIEDSPVGARAAVAAGATVVGLCAGGHCRTGHGDRLRAVGVHHVAAHYGELSALLTL
jgi:HAD superfamily hydrolase (TIGR01509 family)